MSGRAGPPRPRGAPLALQVTALLLGSLVVAQAVTLGLTLALPPAPPPQHPLAEIARALKGEALAAGGGRPLVREVRAEPPSLQSVGWTSPERSRAELAALLGAPEADVRLLFYSPPPFAGAAVRAAALTPPAHRLYAASLAAFLPLEGPADGPQAAGGVPGGFSGGQAVGGRGFGAGAADRIAGSRGALPRGGGREGAGAGGSPGDGGFRSAAPADAGVISRYPSHRPVPLGAPGAARREASVGMGSAAPLAAATEPAAGAGASRATGPFSARAAAAALAATTPGRPLPSSAPAAQPPAIPASSAVLVRDTRGPSVAPVVGLASGLALGAGAAGALAGHPHEASASSRWSAPATSSPPVSTTARTEERRSIELQLAAPLALDAAAPVTPSLAARLSPAQALAVLRGQAARGAADRGGYLLPSSPARAAGLFGARSAALVEGDFVAALRTAPGRWLTVQPQPEGFPTSWQKRVLLWFAVAFGVVAPLGLLFARRLAQPLHDFAAAAERLGKDPSGQHLALAGPAEVGRAAQAFNRMQGRLKRYIDDRTAMVGAISHDLRTPLARMRFRLERVAPEVRGPVLADIAQMEEMISSVLVFIRDASEPAVRERVDLRSILECVVDGAAEVGGEAVLDPGEPVAVDVDSLSVQRVVSNLVENALKYGEHARVRMYADGREAVAEVEDDGPGLPEEEMERVFLPFYRSEQARTLDTRGIGLGLAVSRSIARAHGGDVRLLSRGRGLVAQLRLPIADRAA